MYCLTLSAAPATATESLIVTGDAPVLQIEIPLTVVCVVDGTVYNVLSVVADGDNWPSTFIESAILRVC